MHNAVVQAQHEIAVRYDFKGTKASIDYNKKDNTLTLLADHKGQLETVIQVLKEKMAKRGVPVNALNRGQARGSLARLGPRDPHAAYGHRDRRRPQDRQGDQAAQVKVQAQIMDNKVRVTGKKIDDLRPSSPTSKRTARNIRSSSSTSPDRNEAVYWHARAVALEPRCCSAESQVADVIMTWPVFRARSVPIEPPGRDPRSRSTWAS